MRATRGVERIVLIGVASLLHAKAIEPPPTSYHYALTGLSVPIGFINYYVSPNPNLFTARQPACTPQERNPREGKRNKSQMNLAGTCITRLQLSIILHRFNANVTWVCWLRTAACLQRCLNPP